MHYDTLLGFVLAVGALALSPGPDNIYVLLQSATYGKSSGLATVAGLMTGCLVHTTLVAFGVSAIIKESDTLFWALKIIGAGYLLYLAYKVFGSSSDIDLNSQSVVRKSLGQLFKQGFIMNVLNPKVSLFFLALFPGFLFSETMGNIIQFYILGFLFIAVSFTVFGSIALLAATLARYLKQHRHSGSVFKWLQILVFVGIAVYILVSGK